MSFLPTTSIQPLAFCPARLTRQLGRHHVSSTLFRSSTRSTTTTTLLQPFRALSPYSTTTSPDHSDLSWGDFFKLRHRRRLFERVAMVPSTLLAFSAGGIYFLGQEIDPTTTIFGFEPMVVYTIGLVGCGLAGTLLGPVIGGGIWKVTHRGLAHRMEAKDKVFYHHILHNRSDPSLHSFRNPIPDFYGEKINSVADYRKWLRKQRAHERKATFHLGESSSA
ncbi:TIM23 complex component [Dispira simplex]|nr:TIM23 complex component [Dispira simplex]